MNWLSAAYAVGYGEGHQRVCVCYVRSKDKQLYFLCFFFIFSYNPSRGYSPSSLHPGPMHGSKSWVWGQGTLRSNWAFSIRCLIRLPLSQVAELHADHGDQFE